jgi:hypothetical protein
MASIRNRTTYTSVKRRRTLIHIRPLFLLTLHAEITARNLTDFAALRRLITERGALVRPEFEFLTRRKTSNTLLISWLTRRRHIYCDVRKS